MNERARRALVTIAFTASLGGCALSTDEIGRARFGGDAAGDGITGEAIFQQVIDTGHTSVQVTIAGASPGPHAVFVLDGVCAGADSDVEGPLPHWNPDGAEHGRHRGDLGTIDVDAEGTGVLRITSHRQFVVAEGDAADDVVGHGVSVHASGDDALTEPDGGAGTSIACANVALSD